MTGDDKVVLHERIFLGRYKQTVLCEGEGPITSIRWRGRFAAWISHKVLHRFIWNILREP